MRDRVLTQTADNDVVKRNLTTFPSLPSDKERSDLGPTRPSGHFNYEKQRKGSSEEGWMIVMVCLFACVCVCLWWKRERGSGKMALLAWKMLPFFNYWVQSCQTNHVVPEHTHTHRHS